MIIYVFGSHTSNENGNLKTLTYEALNTAIERSKRVNKSS